jgi:hypothetical protein
MEAVFFATAQPHKATHPTTLFNGAEKNKALVVDGNVQ